MEQRIRERAVKVISEILKMAEYEVHPAPAPLDLSAGTGNICYVIMCSDDRNEITQFVETEYAIQTGSEKNICNKLLVTFDTTIYADGCSIWYPKDFAQYAGEASLAKVLDRTTNLRINGNSASDTTENKTFDDNTTDKIPRISHLPVNISRAAAEDKAGIAGVVSLRFIPFWLFSYKSKGSASFSGQTVSFDNSGRGALNGINGTLVDINHEAVTRREISGQSIILTPSINQNEAIKRITAHLVKSMSKQVKARQVKGDAIFYEEKLLAPSTDNIEVDISEVYLPVWQIKGKKIVEINASTGEILSEPMDNGVEIF